MKKAFLISLLVVLIVCVFVGLASARWVSTFVDGRIFVKIGDHQSRVEYVCGKPNYIHKEVITRGRANRQGYVSGNIYEESEKSFEHTIPVEKWVYSDKILFFEGGFLKAIWK